MKPRGRTKGPNRVNFLSGLLNEDLEALVKWHGGRPQHEQKRFLTGVKNLYDAFSDEARKQEAPKPAVVNDSLALQQPVCPPIAEDDSAEALLAIQESQQMTASASAPALPTRPIDVFEQKRRSRLKHRGDEPRNSLQKWLEDASASSQWTESQATTWTNISSMTQTTLGSACSAPCTMYQQQHRAHARANAVNMRRWKSKKAHEPGALGSGLPHMDYPDNCRLKTSFGDAFGEKPLGQNINKQMYESVFRQEGCPWIESYLHSAQPEKREQFGHMVRALENLRTADHYNTMYVLGYNLKENKRLWKPLKSRPVRDKTSLQQSRIPLGNLAEAGKIKKPPLDPLLEKLRLIQEAQEQQEQEEAALAAEGKDPSSTLPPIAMDVA